VSPTNRTLVGDLSRRGVPPLEEDDADRRRRIVALAPDLRGPDHRIFSGSAAS